MKNKKTTKKAIITENNKNHGAMRVKTAIRAGFVFATADPLKGESIDKDHTGWIEVD